MEDSRPRLSFILAPLALFVAVYLATFIASGYFLRQYFQWLALLSVAVATAITIRIWDHGRFPLGFFVRPGLAFREFALGLAFAAILILACDALIVIFSGVRQSWAGRFPTRDLFALFIPAALHEELAFRGYTYQKLRQWSRLAAIVISSAVFALLHAGNTAVSPLGIANILIAGVLLALAYERFRRLWFPIGTHFAWNVVSGPILGFPVSGFASPQSLLRVTGGGAAVVTGKGFGIEGSLCMTAMEIVGVAFLLNAERRTQNVE